MLFWFLSKLLAHLGVLQLPPRVGQVIPHAVVVLAQTAVLLLRLLPELQTN